MPTSPSPAPFPSPLPHPPHLYYEIPSYTNIKKQQHRIPTAKEKSFQIISEKKIMKVRSDLLLFLKKKNQEIKKGEGKEGADRISTSEFIERLKIKKRQSRILQTP